MPSPDVTRSALETNRMRRRTLERELERLVTARDELILEARTGPHKMTAAEVGRLAGVRREHVHWIVRRHNGRMVAHSKPGGSP